MLTVAGASSIAIVTAGCLGSDDESDNNDDDPDPDDDDDVDGIEIAAGTEIVFDGYTEHWEGVEPEAIAGEQNPTLLLEEGGDYTMEWINADGATHNLEIWDEGDDIIDDLATASIGDEGERDSIEFTAQSEMVTYVCQYHVATQVGDLVVQ